MMETDTATEEKKSIGCPPNISEEGSGFGSCEDESDSITVVAASKKESLSDYSSVGGIAEYPALPRVC